jgi:hypothetical protein
MPVAVAMPLIGMAVSAGMGGLQMAQANKAKKDAQKNIDGFKRQDLVNPANELQVSALSADRQREDIARTMATYGNLAAMGGSRAIAGLLPNLISQQNSQEAQIAAGLDQQQSQIDQIKANSQLAILNMQEKRDNADLEGLGTQLDLANARGLEAKNTFGTNLANGAMNVLNAGFESMSQGNGFFGRAGWGLKPVKVPGSNFTPIIGNHTIQYPNINPQYPKIF